MSLNWDDYLEYKKKERKVEKMPSPPKSIPIQSTIYHFDEELTPKKEEMLVKYDDTVLEDFEPIEERPRRELTPNEKLGFSILGYREYWDDMEKPLIVLDKANINAYLESLGVGAKWMIGFGVYMCSICRADGTKHKLQKVKHLGQICKECATKYQTEIRNLLKYASVMNRMNGSKRE